MGAYLTYLELSNGKEKQVIAFKIDVRCKCSQIPQMTAEKAIWQRKTISSTKKSTTFFHARISRSGKGRVSNFSATRVRVEGVGSPRVAEFRILCFLRVDFSTVF
jgi:hypothetical protein